MSAKIDMGIDAIALSYAMMPLQPVAIYNTMERVSKRPGKNILTAMPTIAEDSNEKRIPETAIVKLRDEWRVGCRD
jgi:hypothetical protein